MIQKFEHSKLYPGYGIRVVASTTQSHLQARMMIMSAVRLKLWALGWQNSPYLMQLPTVAEF